MREHFDEGWNWCRRRPEAALATVLTAVTIAIVAAAGLLSSLSSLPAAALTLGFTFEQFMYIAGFVEFSFVVTDQGFQVTGSEFLQHLVVPSQFRIGVSIGTREV